MKRPNDYDRAVRLLKDLRELATQRRRLATIEARLSQLREQHARKPSFLQRLAELR